MEPRCPYDINGATLKEVLISHGEYEDFVIDDVNDEDAIASKPSSGLCSTFKPLHLL